VTMNMCIVRVVICLTIAVGLCACGGEGNSNTSNNGTINKFTINQNGINSSPWGDGSLSQRPAMAVKFTPASYPVTITSVTIYAKNNTGADQLFNLYGFSELSTEAVIFTPVQNQSIPDTGTSNWGKTISIPATIISSGSFYIAVEWVTKPLATTSGANAFFLCTDNHLDYANTSFVRYSGTNWSNLESINTTSGDLGILVTY
jgi:hypothetical protein